MIRVLVPFLALVLTATPAWAGGSPETTLVVVNEDSPASLQVANAWVQMRDVPAGNVCRLSGIPTLRVITIDEFRERIWEPIQAFMEARGLQDRIDCITYSVDFPYGVNYDADFKGPRPDKRLPRIAALTGMTYLHRMVVDKVRSYEELKTNKYFRLHGGDFHPAHGFRSRYVWTRDERPKTAEADEETYDRYVLSTQLGFTGEQGNTMPEILAYLEAGKACDGTHPDGTVYLMLNGNVRSKTRMGLFEETIAVLDRMGRKALILEQGRDGQDGKVPIGKDDVLGLVAGIASFNWEKSGSEMVPGAIAEHLTSFGAMFNGSGQTKISAFLRAGAIGSSGTVAEPLAIPNKFPSPFLHAYYAEGCSLAEAFYQSIHGPYQLLVVGDPLARPFARFAKVALASPDPKTPWDDVREITARVTPAKGTTCRAVECWIDGRYVAEAPAGEPIKLEAAFVEALEPGSHELRLVAIEDSLVETRSYAKSRFVVKQPDKALVTIKKPRKTTFGKTVAVSGKAPKAKEVAVFHGATELGRTKGGSWKLKLPSERLGIGTVQLHARAFYDDRSAARSAPVDVVVAAPKLPKKGRKKKGGGNRPGLEAEVTVGKRKPETVVVKTIGNVKKNRFLKDVRAKVKGKIASLVLTGEFEVPQAGLYRFAINAQGRLRIEVNGKTVLEQAELVMKRQVYAAFSCSEGWQGLRIEYEPTGSGDLAVLLGGAQVTAPLMGKAIRH